MHISLSHQIDLTDPLRDLAKLNTAVEYYTKKLRFADELVRFGGVLHAARGAMGEEGFSRWLWQQHQIRLQQAERYISVRHMDEGPLRGPRLPLQRLLILKDSDPRLVRVLVEVAGEVKKPRRGEDPLVAARDAGALKLGATGDLAEAEVRVREVARQRPARLTRLQAKEAQLARARQRVRELEAEVEAERDKQERRRRPRGQDAGLCRQNDEIASLSENVAPALKAEPIAPVNVTATATGATPPPDDPTQDAAWAAYDPLLDAVRRLDEPRQQELHECLYATVIGEDPAALRPRLEAALAGVTDVAPALLADFLAWMLHPDREERGSFALWFMSSAEVGDAGMDLRLVLGSELPPRLRREAWELAQEVPMARERPAPTGVPLVDTALHHAAEALALGEEVLRAPMDEVPPELQRSHERIDLDLDTSLRALRRELARLGG